jgi:putative FmdB family regulatory protein
MPTYDYRCSECSFVEEIFQRISDEPLHTCPNCGKETFARVITGGAGVLYKGEGWYVTDYSKKSSGGKDSGPTKSTPVTETPSTPAPAAAPAPAKTPSKE